MYKLIQLIYTKNGLTKGVFAIIFEYSEFYFDNPLIEPFS